MFESFIFELVIGTLTLFTFLGIIVTTLTEAFQTFLQQIRAKYLQQYLRELLAPSPTSNQATQKSEFDQNMFLDAVLNHPLIKPLSSGKRKPSYIPTDLIGRAIIDIFLTSTVEKELTKAEPTFDTLKTKFRAALNAIPSPELKKAMQSLYFTAELSAGNQIELIEKFKTEIGMWFDAAMDRAVGAMRRNAKIVSICIAFVLCLGLNINAIDFMKGLAQDPKARNVIMDIGRNLSGDISSKIQSECKEKLAAVEALQCSLEKSLASLPISNKTSSFVLGWDHTPQFIVSYNEKKTNILGCLFGFLSWLFGIFITAMGASLGGDYWFKILNNVIRLAGAKTASKT